MNNIENNENNERVENHKIAHKISDTFIVKVNNCQNNSWQGEIVWANEKKSVKFRSALEMIRLMDEAIKKEKSIENIFEKEA